MTKSYIVKSKPNIILQVTSGGNVHSQVFQTVYYSRKHSKKTIKVMSSTRTKLIGMNAFHCYLYDLQILSS